MNFTMDALLSNMNMKTGLLRWLIITSLLTLISGCASFKSGIGTIPAVTESATNKHHTGKFVWFDLFTSDSDAAKQFYGNLFGWNFVEDGSYTTIFNNSKPIGGIVQINSGENNKSAGHWLGSLSVRNVAEAAKLIQAEGGTVHEGPMSLDGRGEMAIVSDPQGAQLIVLYSAQGDPVDQQPELNEWMWMELWAKDKNAAIDFYQKLVGYSDDAVKDGYGDNYTVLMRDGTHRAGVVTLPWERANAIWAPYIRVSDPAAVAAQAKASGGKVVVPPSENFDSGSMAIIAGPTGEALIVQKWVEQRATGR